MGLPNSINHKIFRSITHLKELHAELERYFETNPAKVIRQPGGSPDQFIGKVQAGSPVPARLPIIIGDCLQNLRSALDYLIWELVLSAKNNPGKNNMFPICSTLKSFDDQTTRLRRLNGVPPDAFTEIQALQPYHHGQDFEKTFLWIIDDLCNINKHRRVLLTDLRGARANIEIETIDGKLLGRTDMGRVEKNATIGPFPIVPGVQGPGIQVDTEIKILSLIAFDEGAARDMEVSLVLQELLRYVADGVLPRFEKFFK